MQPATALDWSRIHRLTPGEWPAGVLERMDGRVIEALSDIRKALPDPYAIIPSPVGGAHVRTSGSVLSRHYVGDGRLADATDFFMQWDHVWLALQVAQQHPDIGGIGIYTDAMLRGQEGDYAMVHIDLRPQRLQWVAWRQDRDHPTEYVYLLTDPLRYHRILAERGRAA